MKSIERLLRLTADFQNFCNETGEAVKANDNSGELSLEELDFIAAAALFPQDRKDIADSKKDK